MRQQVAPCAGRSVVGRKIETWDAELISLLAKSIPSFKLKRTMRHIKKSQFTRFLNYLMSKNAQSNYVLNHKFDDFDQMCEEVREWNLDFSQLERGRFAGEVLQFGTETIHIAEATFGRGLLQRGTPPDGLVTIAVPATREVRIKWRGCEVTGTDLMIFPRGSELDSVSDDSFHVYTCSFPQELFASISEQSGIASMEELQNGRDVIRCPGKAISRIQRLLRLAAMSARSKGDGFNDANKESLILHSLPQLILQGIAASNGATVPRIPGRRDSLVKNAVGLIERFADQPIAIRDLVSDVGVSQRTLENAFHESLGVPPKTYLMYYRLNKVHRELRSSRRDSVKVSDIANRWGFWHMGQFAADYRKLFGQLPSQTLQSSSPTTCSEIVR